MAGPTGIRLALAAAIAGYLGFLLWYMCPYAGGSDSSGYLNSAKLLTEGRLSTPARIPDGIPPEIFPASAFVPSGFAPGPVAGQVMPSYPVGLPLLLALGSLVAGLGQAVTVVNLVTALACMLLLYALARDFGVRPPWAVAATALFACSPLTVSYALQPMSDLPSAALALATVLCAGRAGRQWRWAAGAGASIAFAVLVRPSNLLLFAPAAVALGFSRRSWLAFVLGGLPAAVFLAAYQHALYGSVFRTGYGNTGFQFSSEYILPTLGHYAVWLPVILSPLVVAAIAVTWSGLPRRTLAILAVWAGVFAAFYSTYSFTHQTWWYLRFLLPAAPALLIAAALVLQRLAVPRLVVGAAWDRGTTPMLQPRTVPVAAIAVLVALLWEAWWGHRLFVPQVEAGDRSYRQVAAWVAESLPPDSLIAASQTSGSLFFYTNRPFIDWHELTPQSYAALNTILLRDRRTLYASLFFYEEAPALQEKMPGIWEPVAKYRYATIWRRVTAPNPATTP
jgi:hypothetical protein